MNKRFRTINGAYDEILEEDPKTAITRNGIREGVNSGGIPCKEIGRTQVITIEDVYAYYTPKEATNEAE